MGKQDVKGKGRARVVGRPRARSKTRAERPKVCSLRSFLPARGARCAARDAAKPPHTTRHRSQRAHITYRAQLIEEDPAITERILKDQLKLMGLYAAHTVGGSHSPWPRRPSS